MDKKKNESSWVSKDAIIGIYKNLIDTKRIPRNGAAYKRYIQLIKRRTGSWIKK
tara:strand:- start:477 stop:638 length:162 start_codon:yes stop_codon:yes gene_type:complete